MLRGFSNMFKCCAGENRTEDNEDFRNEEIKKQKLLVKNNIQSDLQVKDLNEILIQDNLVLKEEADIKIQFSIQGIKNYLESYDKLDGFELLFEKGNLILHNKKNGSELTNKFCLGKSQYKIEKAKYKGKLKLKDIRDLVKLILILGI